MSWIKHKYYLQGDGWTITKCGKEGEYLYSLFRGINRIDAVFTSSVEAIKHYDSLNEKRMVA